MFILLFFQLHKQIKMGKLNESQIQILSDFHSRRHLDAWEAWGDLYDALEKHGIETKYYVYEALCKHMGTIVKSYPNKFICDLNSRNYYLIFNKISKNFFIKVLKTMKVPKDKYI